MFGTAAERETGDYTMFGIQTLYQRELWKKHANEIVIVDSSAGVSRYKHVLYSIVTVDKDNVGHCIAWLIIPAESSDDIQPLLRELKRLNGDTSPRIFASDDANALYNSWLVTQTLTHKS